MSDDKRMDWIEAANAATAALQTFNQALRDFAGEIDLDVWEYLRETGIVDSEDT